MSRIKGSYQLKHDDSTVVRWLDPTNGKCYPDEKGNSAAVPLFKPQPDGTWFSEWGYTWVPDAALAANWYVICLEPFTSTAYPKMAPSYTTFGPYTEAEARKNAELRSLKSAGRDGVLSTKSYAVVQVQAGNTVLVQPPAPPQPVTIWS